MSEKKTCEIYLAINEEGDYSVHVDADGVAEQMNEDCGGACRRVIKLIVNVTPPTLDEVEIDVIETAGAIEKIEVEAE